MTFLDGVVIVLVVWTALTWRRMSRRVDGLPCAGCGYDLTGIKLRRGTCPECGAAAVVRETPRYSQHDRLKMAGVMLGIAGSLLVVYRLGTVCPALPTRVNVALARAGLGPARREVFDRLYSGVLTHDEQMAAYRVMCYGREGRSPPWTRDPARWVFADALRGNAAAERVVWELVLTATPEQRGVLAYVFRGMYEEMLLDPENIVMVTPRPGPGVGVQARPYGVSVFTHKHDWVLRVALTIIDGATTEDEAAQAAWLAWVIPWHPQRERDLMERLSCRPWEDVLWNARWAMKEAREK